MASDAHLVVLTIFRQRGMLDEFTCKKIWSAVWNKFSVQLSNRGFDVRFEVSWRRLLEDINASIRPFGFEIRQDKDKRKQPPQYFYFYVNLWPDKIAEEEGTGGNFDAISIEYIRKLIEAILQDGPKSGNDCLNMKVQLDEMVKDSKRSLSKVERQDVLDRCVKMGFLELDDNNDYTVGMRAFQDLREMITSDGAAAIAPEVNWPFVWIK